ncbi:hypothetical protein SAMN04488103_107101 [Gemmobacter aquatilis]|uniref:Glycosyl transferase family 2 n=1 Tax=Gemmobacter aquatilis TaxID=933059 RepID=A0A1H8J0Q8_9RHOB|nr:hypothetical protein [Gemmobacter aquatilis]SEN74219.1 hypothetical protein SAMN04488103_107101 [Gemmobacter aquatilis]
MRYKSLPDFIASRGTALDVGPVAMIFAEDPVEVASTLRHHLDTGFRTVLLFIHDEIFVDPALEDRVHRIRHDVHAEEAVTGAVDAVTATAAPGIWLYYCFNAEYLFFPFCESRTVRDMLSFHTEERRDAMLTYVVDLYAGDLERFPDAVSLEDAHLDRSGYYALGRTDPEKNWAAKERQLDFFGGLRWRFEEHVTWSKRKIDRISLFRAKTGLQLRGDFTFTDEEYNTYACPWHHNITAAICSFRTAKALKTNPGSRYQIQTFRWHSSTEFRWHSQQLMELGLMEPGQWF